MLQTIGSIDFSSLLHILDGTTTTVGEVACAEGSEFYTLASVLNMVLNIIRIAVPIILILYGTIDLAKAVMASKDDEIKAAQKLLIKRAIYAVAIFLLVTIIKLLFKLLGNIGDADSVLTCFTTLGF